MRAFTDTTADGQAPAAGEQVPPSPLSAERSANTAPDGSNASGLEVADQIIHLVRTWSYLKARLTSTVDPELGSLFLIGRLVKEGPTRAKDLAEATCADQSTISRQVAALVKAGLIERQADPDDGRASILVPTPLGVERMNKHFANRGRALEPLLTDWTDDERSQFVQLLRRFTTDLESRRDEIAKLMTQSHADATAYLPAARTESHTHTEHAHAHDSTERFN